MATRKSAPTARFVLLPARGLHSHEMRAIKEGNPAFNAAATSRLEVLSLGGATPKPSMKIVHSVAETGPKLVEMGPTDIAALRVSNPGVRVVPVVKYELAKRPILTVQSKVKSTAGVRAPKLTIQFVDRVTQKPLRGVLVVAFTDFEARVGASGQTNARGKVGLDLGASAAKLELLVAYGPPGYWGLGKRTMTLKNDQVFQIEPVDLAVPDFAAMLYGGISSDAGENVRVGVIDSGVDGTHPDLNVAGGAAFVVSEDDAGGSGPAKRAGEHGTHVAGIIASTGALHPQPPKEAPGKRGIAPKVTLFSYRVFPNSGEGADNYDILRAIEQGIADQCDLLNLSLGSPYPDDTVESAIKEAFDNGTVCIVATGNDDRAPVSYPAAWDISVAVTSAGKKGSYPATSNETLDEVAPYAKTDKDIYISSFSNVGPRVDFTGPGGGIVSTLPGRAYGVMSGTSMACPAVTGMAAALLSANPSVLAMPRNRDRALAILQLMSASAKSLGFAPTLEGVGLMS